MLLIAGGAAAAVLTTRRGDKQESRQTTAPTSAQSSQLPTIATTQDFPSEQPTSSPTSFAATSAGGGTSSDQNAIAHNAETVLHAIAAEEPSTFCPLIDPADLDRLLKEKSLTSCNDITLKSAADRADYAAFTVDDPAEIVITGDTARIPKRAISPAGFGAVDMRQDADGTWKFRFYSD